MMGLGLFESHILAMRCNIVRLHMNLWREMKHGLERIEFQYSQAQPDIERSEKTVNTHDLTVRTR